MKISITEFTLSSQRTLSGHFKNYLQQHLPQHLQRYFSSFHPFTTPLLNNFSAFSDSSNCFWPIFGIFISYRLVFGSIDFRLTLAMSQSSLSNPEFTCPIHLQNHSINSSCDYQNSISFTPDATASLTRLA